MKRSILLLTLIALLVAGCAAAKSTISPEVQMIMPSTQGGDRYEEESYAAEAPVAEMDASTGEYGGSGNAVTTAVQERMIIQTANLTIVVVDPEAKMNEIYALAKEMGGWLVSMNIYQTSTSSGKEVPEAYITIRVPYQKLDQAMSQIKTDVVEVQNENISGEDVTQTVVDLDSRLHALEAAEQELLAIMEQAKSSPGNTTTTMTQDVLQVYNRIIEIRQEIEQIEGQRQYYATATSYSAISVSIVAQETIEPLEIYGWKPEGIARDAVQALINLLQGLVSFLIWIAIFVLPMLIIVLGPIALIIWGIVALVRRRRAKKAAGTKK